MTAAGRGIALAGLLLSGCVGPGAKGPCSGIVSEYIPGFSVTGLSLASNGRGYLSAVVDFGDCSGYTEGRVFAIDALARTAEPVPVDFWPGKSSMSPDGMSGVLMGYKAWYGPDGVHAQGAVFLQGADAGLLPFEATPSVEIDSTVYDIQPADGGWVASARDAGAFHVSYDGTFVQLAPGAGLEAVCGAQSLDRYLLCSEWGGSEVQVVSTTSGQLVSTLMFDGPVENVSARGAVAVVLHGSSISLVQEGAVEEAFVLDPGDLAWHAQIWGDYLFVGGIASARLIRLSTKSVDELGTFSDVALVGGQAVIAFEGERILEVVDLSVIEGALVDAPVGTGRISRVEAMANAKVLVASSYSYNSLDEHEEVPVFTEFDPATGEWGPAWSVSLELP